MTSYITSNLLPDEKIIFRTHRHWVVFLPALVWFLLAWFILYFIGFGLLFSVILFGFVIVVFILSLINYKMSELAVTNLRVLVKVGFIARSSLETNLQNIATISVDQTILGRALGYGTLNIYDTGSRHSPFALIAEPFQFRKAVLSQLEKRYPAPE